ncbi:hypothetical protein NB689_002684 [Xanthomonas sacchari]|nr:hypothetical protein [Xanthomonas sacchari]
MTDACGGTRGTLRSAPPRRAWPSAARSKASSAAHSRPAPPWPITRRDRLVLQSAGPPAAGRVLPHRVPGARAGRVRGRHRKRRRPAQQPGALRPGRGPVAAVDQRPAERRPGLPVGRHAGRPEPLRRASVSRLPARTRQRQPTEPAQQQHRQHRLRAARHPPVAGHQRRRPGSDRAGHLATPPSRHEAGPVAQPRHPDPDRSAGRRMAGHRTRHGPGRGRPAAGAPAGRRCAGGGPDLDAGRQATSGTGPAMPAVAAGPRRARGTVGTARHRRMRGPAVRPGRAVAGLGERRPVPARCAGRGAGALDASAVGHRRQRPQRADPAARRPRAGRHHQCHGDATGQRAACAAAAELRHAAQQRHHPFLPSTRRHLVDRHLHRRAVPGASVVGGNPQRRGARQRHPCVAQQQRAQHLARRRAHADRHRPGPAAARQQPCRLAAGARAGQPGDPQHRRRPRRLVAGHAPGAVAPGPQRHIAAPGRAGRRARQRSAAGRRHAMGGHPPRPDPRGRWARAQRSALGTPERAHPDPGLPRQRRHAVDRLQRLRRVAHAQRPSRRALPPARQYPVPVGVVAVRTRRRAVGGHLLRRAVPHRPQARRGAALQRPRGAQQQRHLHDPAGSAGAAVAQHQQRPERAGSAHAHRAEPGPPRRPAEPGVQQRPRLPRRARPAVFRRHPGRGRDRSHAPAAT